MGLILPRNWCLIFFADPDEEFTSTRVRQLLEERGLTVEGDEPPFTVRWGDGPTLQLKLQRGSHLKTIVKSVVGTRRKFQKYVADCDSQIKIELSDVDAVLDEINTLIEVQATLQDATGGLMYTAWNDNLAGPEK